MRCRACNTELTDIESVKKDAATGEYVDLCLDCLITVRETVRELDEPVVSQFVVSSIDDNENF